MFFKRRGPNLVNCTMVEGPDAYSGRNGAFKRATFLEGSEVVEVLVIVCFVPIHYLKRSNTY